MHRYAADASMVLHAGDLGDPDLLLAFDAWPVHRVLGNTDIPSQGVAVRKRLTIGCFKIGLTHGWGARREIEEKIRQAFSDQALDAIVYGHTHFPVCHWHDGILMFNPGSCVDRRTAPHCTFGILEMRETLSGTIVNIDELAMKYLFT